jgi:molybdopterin-guanine dinucleotide biosynthesis protein A
MQDTVAIAILAGGAGRRLGGADKALVLAGGRPLLALAADRLRHQAEHIVLSANGEPSRFAAFGWPVVADRVADAGPLAGIAATAAYCAATWPTVRAIVTVPVDVARPPLYLVARLASAQAESGGVALAEAGGRRHWAIACWPLAAAIALTKPVANGDWRRVADAVRANGYTGVAFPDAEAFHNINTPADLMTFEQSLTQI